MSNIVIATQTVTALLELLVSTTAAVARYNALIEKARGEGRDISDAELDGLRAESQRLTDDIASNLR